MIKLSILKQVLPYCNEQSRLETIEKAPTETVEAFTDPKEN